MRLFINIIILLVVILTLVDPESARTARIVNTTTLLAVWYLVGEIKKEDE